jgi:hypothetical protein
MQGAATQAMRCHRRGAATQQMPARRRAPLGCEAAKCKGYSLTGPREVSCSLFVPCRGGRVTAPFDLESGSRVILTSGKLGWNLKYAPCTACTPGQGKAGNRRWERDHLQIPVSGWQCLFVHGLLLSCRLAFPDEELFERNSGQGLDFLRKIRAGPPASAPEHAHVRFRDAEFVG